MLELLAAEFGDKPLLDYAHKAAILLDSETLGDWPLRFVPVTKDQFESLRTAVKDFTEGKEVVRPFHNEEPEPPKVKKKVDRKDVSV